VRRLAANLAYGVADRLGVNWLRRRFRQGIAVLMYHGLLPDDAGIDAWTMVRAAEFRRQMRYLEQRCDFVSMPDLLAAGSAGRLAAARSGKPRVMITFDDGYRSNYTLALPILAELGIPATVFVATGFVDTRDSFWYDKVILALQLSRTRSLDLRGAQLGVFDLPVSPAERRWDAIQRVLSALKTLDLEPREKLAEEIRVNLRVSDSDLELFVALRGADVTALHRSGLVHIGSHTDRHEILTQASPAAAEATICTSLDKLRALTGENCRVFSYPNGDFNDELMGLLRRLGVEFAFTTRRELWSAACSAHAIPRIGIGAYDDAPRFAALASGLR
jgi:peptidoglycan/xylan/chitin deacetylase (PgdA/CDA1 family)